MVNIMALSGRTIGLFVAPGFDEKQVSRVTQELRLRDATTVVIGTGDSTAVAMSSRGGALIKPDTVLKEVSADDLDAIIITGGQSTDRLSTEERALTLLVGMQRLGKPVAAIGNGPLVAIAAGITTGRKVAGAETVRDKAGTAGADFTEKELAVDHKLITAKDSEDITHFIEAMALLLEPATTFG